MMKYSEMEKVFREIREYMGQHNTPRIVGYYHIGSLICEISAYTLGKKKHYKVLIITLPNKTVSELSKTFDTCDEAINYLPIAATEHLLDPDT